MTGEQIVFFVVATFTVLMGLGMVSVNSVFHAALFMVACFTGIAALFMTLGAGFLGIIQILVYVGAIAVLMIFAIMLTPRVMQQTNQSRYTGQWPLAAALAAGLVVLLTGPLLGTPWPVSEEGPGLREYALEIGLGFMDPTANGYLLPFWLASVLLLVALVGAIVIAREDRGGGQ
jgi:NADH-quinone oxidoreductase subunit J